VDAEALSQMVEQCSTMMASMQQMMDGMDSMGGMGGMAGALGRGPDATAGAAPIFLVAAISVAVVLLAAVAAYWIGRSRYRVREPAAVATEPEQELARRYAAGDLDREQFLRIRNDLRGAHT